MLILFFFFLNWVFCNFLSSLFHRAETVKKVDEGAFLLCFYFSKRTLERRGIVIYRGGWHCHSVTFSWFLTHFVLYSLISLWFFFIFFCVYAQLPGRDWWWRMKDKLYIDKYTDRKGGWVNERDRRGWVPNVQ